MVGFRSNTGTRGTRIIGLIFALIGAGLLIGAGISFVQTQRFLAGTAVAQGEVVDLVMVTDEDGDRSYRPVVAFTTLDGQEIEFRSSVGSSRPSLDAGDMVDVRYDPARPREARINSFATVWFLTTLLALMGLFFAMIGTLLAVFGPVQKGITWSKRWTL